MIDNKTGKKINLMGEISLSPFGFLLMADIQVDIHKKLYFVAYKKSFYSSLF